MDCKTGVGSPSRGRHDRRDVETASATGASCPPARRAAHADASLRPLRAKARVMGDSPGAADDSVAAGKRRRHLTDAVSDSPGDERRAAADSGAEDARSSKRARSEADATAVPLPEEVDAEVALEAPPVGLQPELLSPGNTISVADVQDVVLHALLDGPAPKWLRLQTAVPRIVVLMLHGLDWQTWTERSAALPSLRDRFPPPVRVYGTSPHTTSVQSVMGFMTCRQQAAAKVQRGAVRPNLTKRQPTPAVQRLDKEQPMPYPPTYYQLTPVEMADNNYPLPVLHAESGELRCPAGFVVTQPAGQGIARTPAHEMLALDCEMCYTAAGLEVTRCSVVDASCAVVYDTLIMPSTPILDYNTAHSGITAALMAGVTTTLADVQAHLLDIVAEETLLIGHSLENDLNSLKLIHRAVVDTSLMFTHPRGPPFKPALRVLCERLLNRRIQEGSHDSVADAVATMALARLKFAKGPAFGEVRPDGVPLADLLGDAGQRVSLVDRSKSLTRLATGSASAIAATSDADAAVKAAREARKPLAAGPHLVWAHLADLAALQEARAQRARRRAEAQAGDDAAAEEAASDEQQEAAAEARALSQVDAAVAAVLDQVPEGTLVLVHSGHGDTAAARRLLESKFRRNQGLSGGPWGDADEAALTRASERARNGLLFVALKQAYQ